MSPRWEKYLFIEDLPDLVPADALVLKVLVDEDMTFEKPIRAKILETRFELKEGMIVTLKFAELSSCTRLGVIGRPAYVLVRPALYSDGDPARLTDGQLELGVIQMKRPDRIND